MTSDAHTFTGVGDTDRLIFQELHGGDLFAVVQVDKYTAQLCNDDFWSHRVRLLFGRPVNYQEQRRLYRRLSAAAKWETVLVWASSFGHDDVVAALLEKKVDVHWRDEAPLRWAVLNGRLQAATRLLKAGANANVNNAHMLRTPIMNKDVAMIALLLRAGANISISLDLFPAIIRLNDRELTSVLIQTCDVEKMGHELRELLKNVVVEANLDLIDEILAKGLNINDGRENDPTLLSIAVKQGGNHGVVRYLLNKGADPNHANYQIVAASSYTNAVSQMIESIAEKDDLTMLELFIEYGFILTPRLLQIGLVVAAAAGARCILVSFIERGVSIDAKTPYEDSRYIAIKNGKADVARLLLSLSVNNDFLNAQMIVSAAQNGHTEIVRLLLETETIQATMTVRLIREAIQMAVESQSEEIVRLLLDAVTVPLFIEEDWIKSAVVNADLPTLRLLLERGTWTTKYHRLRLDRPLLFALEKNISHSSPVIDLLIATGADPRILSYQKQDYKLYHDCYNLLSGYNYAKIKASELYHSLINLVHGSGRDDYNTLAKAIINQAAVDQRLMVIAIQQNNELLVKSLFEEGFVVDSQHQLLKEAIKSHNSRIVELILQHNPSSPSVDRYIHDFLLSIKLNARAVVRSFIRHGADPNAHDGAPLILAVQSDNLGIVDILLQAGADPLIRNGDALRIALENKNREIHRLLTAKTTPPSST